MSDLFKDLPSVIGVQSEACSPMSKSIVILIILKLTFIKGREGFRNLKHLIVHFHFPVEKTWT